MGRDYESYDIDWCPGYCMQHFASCMGAVCYELFILYSLCNRVPGRLGLYTHLYIVTLLASLSVSAFIYHAFGLGLPFYHTASVWTLLQVTFWSLYGLYWPYRCWPLSLIGAIIYIWAIPRSTTGDFTLVCVLFSLVFLGLGNQEFFRLDASRQRACSLLWMMLCVCLWVACHVCESDLSLQGLGQVGMGLVHVVQGYLLTSWHYFWLQQERDYFEPWPCLKGTAVTLS